MFILGNLFWSFVYNISIMPIAAGFFEGVTISPVVASAAMSGSSLIVVLFSNLIRFCTFEDKKWKLIEEV